MEVPPNGWFINGNSMTIDDLEVPLFQETHIYIYIPVVPHKAVAEVSKIGHYRRGELL